MAEHNAENDAPSENDAPRWKERRRKMAAGYYDRRRDDDGEDVAALSLAEDGKPGCPVIVWDGPYSTRCSLGATGGRCAYHGTFLRPIPPGDGRAND